MISMVLTEAGKVKMAMIGRLEGYGRGDIMDARKTWLIGCCVDLAAGLFLSKPYMQCP
jgi:hypothetical protein